MAEGTAIKFNTRVDYKIDFISYEIIIRSQSDELVGGIRAKLLLPPDSNFDVVETSKPIDALDPGKTAKLEFKLMPKILKPARTVIRGSVSYFDFRTRTRYEHELQPRLINLFLPRELKPIEIDDLELRIQTAGYPKTEHESDVIPLGASKLFELTSAELKSIGFFMLKPQILPEIYRAMARFHAIDRLNRRYAVYIEVIGYPDRSKIFIRSFAQETQLLLGLHFGIIDKLDKKYKLRKYLITKKE